MLKKNHIITVFEHQSIRTDRAETRLSETQRQALERFYGDNGVTYYSLIHKGVRFSEYVGVIQVGNTVIEVLPKADKNDNKSSWREVLIGMLKAVGVFDTHAPTSASLSLKSNSILDLYFVLFISEVEQLLHRGLIKRYNKIEGNTTALKGSIQFAKHFQKNVVHAERFYVRYTTYNQEHPFNQVLCRTLRLLKRINQNPYLHSRIGSLLLNFPELNEITIDEAFFTNLAYNRKTEPYRKAMDIARLLLLNYHPDLNQGKNDVLALMFDMNMLWEKFVLRSIEKYKPIGITVQGQSKKDFWQSKAGSKTKLIPDIVVECDKSHTIVLDTKWKTIGTSNPSADDLQQMYAYIKHYNASRAALIYPGEEQLYRGGKFCLEENAECGVYLIRTQLNIQAWQKQIAAAILPPNSY